jgi:pSer/pThr/pTyr-binding forkhead associated (FHA) protein
MSYVFCNQCGHRNPPDSNFCSSCGEPLDVLDDRTITLTAVDPKQEAAGSDDDVVVPVGELERGVGVLIVRAGSQAGPGSRSTATVTTLGRHPDSEISLDDITVSRRHAEITRTADGYVVVDAGSLNGTYVNQERVERSRCSTATSSRSASSGSCSSSGDG